MQTDELAYYRETLIARLGRLWRLRRTYSDQPALDPHRMLYRGYMATLADCRQAGLTMGALRPYLSFAPTPPAKPSPEGSP